MTYTIYTMKIQLSKKYHNNISKCVKSKDDIYSKRRECILTKVNRYIKTNIRDDIGEENFSRMLNNINDNNIKFKDAFLRFESNSKRLFVYFPYKLDILRCEIYSFNIDKELRRVKFQLYDIKYVSEVI